MIDEKLIQWKSILDQNKDQYMQMEHDMIRNYIEKANSILNQDSINRFDENT